MRHRGSATSRAFSLVELVIVIVIIGIIAAIAVPRISRSAIGASESALRGNLATLRNAIDRYAAEHNGAFPGFHKIDGSQDGEGNEGDFYAQLTEQSSVTGSVESLYTFAGWPPFYGPYIREMPRLTVGKNADEDADEVKFDENSPPEEEEGNKKGWMYNPETGEIIANTKDCDSQGTPFTEY